MKTTKTEDALNRLHNMVRRLAMYEIGMDKLNEMSRKESQATLDEHMAATITTFAIYVDSQIHEYGVL
jgi:hypothetical protein